VSDPEPGALIGPPILETVSLFKRFGGVDAIAGVDFTLRPGELRCLIGPNGAGKSTFFRMLTAQMKPSAGRILFEGNDITGLAPHKVSRLGIGIKNQVPDVYDNLSVHENIWLSARFRRGPRQARSVTEAVIERFGLGAIATARVGELAHGQRQWIEFAMVMALEPKLILLDEPTSGMSAEETSRTAELIRQAATRSAIIVVEHDMQFIRQIAALVTVFHQGRILAEGRMAEIQANPAVRDVYLGRSGRA
jgi:branched-chain amino acid transport system ATP-binding protein/urea transport system ATP-binding protein